jgi:hypothetical protein
MRANQRQNRGAVATGSNVRKAQDTVKARVVHYQTWGNDPRECISFYGEKRSLSASTD